MLTFTGSKWIDYGLFVLIVLTIAFVVFRVLRFLLRRFLIRSSKQLNVDPTNYAFLNNALNLIVLVITVTIILYSIPEFKQVGITLFAGAGIFAAILGFASQAAFSNIISGIFIVIFKPFSVGDVVKVSDKYAGIIEDITLRHVVIKDFENKRYVVPNSIISNDVIQNSNLYDDKLANFILVSISYESDLNHAIDVMRDEVLKHPLLIDNRSEEEIEAGEELVVIRVMALDEYSVNLRATAWTKDFGDGFVLKTDLNKALKFRFDSEGIEIPYPHRTIVSKQNGKVT